MTHTHTLVQNTDFQLGRSTYWQDKGQYIIQFLSVSDEKGLIMSLSNIEKKKNSELFATAKLFVYLPLIRQIRFYSSALSF